MSREELRGRAGAADERVFAHLLTALEAEGIVSAERDKVRLATHEVRLTPEQQKVVDRVEAGLPGRRGRSAEPRGGAGAGRRLPATRSTSSSRCCVEARKLVRVKESLFFHARRSKPSRTSSWPCSGSARRSVPADIKDLLGISRKYAIPAARVLRRAAE